MKSKVLITMILATILTVASLFYFNRDSAVVIQKDKKHATNSSKVSTQISSENFIPLSADEVKSSMSDYYKPTKISEQKKEVEKNTSNKSHSDYYSRLVDLINKEGDQFNKNYSLDTEIQKLIKDNNLKRSEKITLLWSLYKVSFENKNIQSASYILEVLSSLQPIELVDDVISSIGLSPDELKLKLLNLLADSFRMYSNPELANNSPETIDFVISQGEKIRNFFDSAIFNPYNANFFKQTLLLYPSIATPEKYYLIDSAIQQNSSLISVKEALTIRTEFAIMNSETMQQSLPTLISSLENKKYPNEDRLEVIQKLSAFTKDSLLNTENNLNADSQLSIPNDVKYKVGELIKRNEPNLTINDVQNVNIIKQADYADWLTTYSLTQTNSKPERITFINNYINSIPVEKQVSAIGGLAQDKEILNSLKINAILIKNLEDYVYNPNTNSEVKKIINETLTVLK